MVDSATSAEDVVTIVESMLLARHHAGSLKSEADYLAGAITVMQAIFGDGSDNLTTEVPVKWVMYTMSGRPLLDELLERENH